MSCRSSARILPPPTVPRRLFVRACRRQKSTHKQSLRGHHASNRSVKSFFKKNVFRQRHLCVPVPVVSRKAHTQHTNHIYTHTASSKSATAPLRPCMASTKQYTRTVCAGPPCVEQTGKIIFQIIIFQSFFDSGTFAPVAAVVHIFCKCLFNYTYCGEHFFPNEKHS